MHTVAYQKWLLTSSDTSVNNWFDWKLNFQEPLLLYSPTATATPAPAPATPTPTPLC